MILQGSVEWHLQRIGKVTASRVADVVARTKTGWGASRANYAAELIAERLTGVPAVGYQNEAMRWGTETEPRARTAFEFFHDVAIDLAGFADHPTIPMTGASPDGYVGTDGLIEIKCPTVATHIDTLLGKTVPAKYITQMMWQMACTGRAYCWFASFDPRMPSNMQLYVERVNRDDKLIASLEADVRMFLQEIDARITELTALYGGMERAA